MRLIPPSPVSDDAEFTPDGLERLWLSRRVAETGPVGLVIALNPSTAGATVESNDHTIKKMAVFTKQWGWSGFWMVNLFTCIETYSAKLKNLSFESAVGRYGTQVLEYTIPLAEQIVVCWGSAVPKNKRHRVPAVETRLRVLRREGTPVFCFGRSKAGDPVHPLRLSYETHLVPYKISTHALPVSRRDEE